MSEAKIIEAAVEAACQSCIPQGGGSWRDLYSPDEQAEHIENMRQALAAALPHLRPQPAELAEQQGDALADCPLCGSSDVHSYYDEIRYIGFVKCGGDFPRKSCPLCVYVSVSATDDTPAKARAAAERAWNEMAIALAATGKQQIDQSWSLHDRVEFALRDAGFDLDEASRIALQVDGKQQAGEVQGDVRVQFEAWASREGYPIRRGFGAADDYDFVETRRMWQSWQAARQPGVG